MKKLTILLLILCSYEVAAQDYGHEFETNAHWETLIEAMAWNESRHDSTVVSKSGTYVGYLQIGPMYIKCANQVVGYNKYSRDDCFSRVTSIEIFNVVNTKYNPNKSAERAMLLHTGANYPDWKGYRQRVKNNYIRLRNEQNK